MLISPGGKVVSIGSSCINTFQMEFFLRDHQTVEMAQKTALFDWNICPPDATITLLRHAKMGTLKSMLSDRARYMFHPDTSLITHDALKGFLFFHEEAPEHVLGTKPGFEAFVSKTLHLVDNLLSAPEKQTCVFWSNLQPNLRETVEGLMGWEPFVLTAQRYGQIKSLARANFGDNAEFTFVSRAEDTCKSLHDKPDVTLMTLARGADYEGATGLFEPHLKAACGGAFLA